VPGIAGAATGRFAIGSKDCGMKEFAVAARLVIWVSGKADAAPVIALVTPSPGLRDHFPFADTGLWFSQMLPYGFAAALSVMAAMILGCRIRKLIAAGMRRASVEEKHTASAPAM
jgi:hypothetical protein